jgi:hypothetical protein
MNNTVIVSGGSYVQGMPWCYDLFPEAEILNLARSGTGNRYIADSIISAIDPQHPPKAVFIVWSNINNVDVLLPVNSTTTQLVTDHGYYGKINSTYYYFSGGNKFVPHIANNYLNIKQSDWPTVVTVDDYINLPQNIQEECKEHQLFWFKKNTLEEKIQNYIMVQYLSSTKYHEDSSYNSIVTCQNFLELHKIPYQFTFVENPFGRRNKQFGKLTKTHKMYSQINWSKYISNTPYEYGLKYNLIGTDGYHLTVNGFNQWAQSMKSMILLDNNLQSTNPIKKIYARIKLEIRYRQRLRDSRDEDPYIYK